MGPSLVPGLGVALLFPLLDDLPTARNRQGVRGNALHNSRSCRHVGAAPDGHRSDELGVAADESAVFDDGSVFS